MKEIAKEAVGITVAVVIAALLLWGSSALLSIGLHRWAKLAITAIRDIGWAAFFLIWAWGMIVLAERCVAGSRRSKEGVE